MSSYYKTGEQACYGSYEHQEFAVPPGATVQYLNPACLSLAPGPQMCRDVNTFYQPSPTPLEILNGNIPRRVTFQKVPLGDFDKQTPSVSISFSVGGYAGPSVKDILHGKVIVDSPDEHVFAPLGHRRVRSQVIWPGLDIPGNRLEVIHKSGRPMTRMELAQEIASRIYAIQEGLINPPKRGRNSKVQEDSRWPLSRIKLEHIRLVGFNYYRDHWIPILVLELH